MLKTISLLVFITVFLFFTTLTLIFVFPHTRALRDCYVTADESYLTALSNAKKNHISDEALCQQEKGIINNFSFCINNIKTTQTSAFIFSLTEFVAENFYRYKKTGEQLPTLYKNYCVVEATE